jgi:hypothetical protein
LLFTTDLVQTTASYYETECVLCQSAPLQDSEVQRTEFERESNPQFQRPLTKQVILLSYLECKVLAAASTATAIISSIIISININDSIIVLENDGDRNISCENEVLHKDKKERNMEHTIKQRKTNWTGQLFASKQPFKTRYWREYRRNERREEKTREEL